MCTLPLVCVIHTVVTKLLIHTHIKKCTLCLYATKGFVSFHCFCFVSILTQHNLKSIVFVSIFCCSFSIFLCPTKNTTGDRADRWELHEWSIGKATWLPRPWFLAQEALDCARNRTHIFLLQSTSVLKTPLGARILRRSPMVPETPETPGCVLIYIYNIYRHSHSHRTCSNKAKVACAEVRLLRGRGYAQLASCADSKTFRMYYIHVCAIFWSCWFTWMCIFLLYAVFWSCCQWCWYY